MVMDCSFCGKRADKSAMGKTFHHFPLHQPELLQSWLKNINLGSNFTPTKTMRLCSDHFRKEYFQTTKTGVKLVSGSVPTIFGTYKSVCAYCSAIKTHEDQRSFHKFPLRHPRLLEKWIAAIGKENFKPSETSQLCSNHFASKCFRPSGYGTSQRLRINAVPTIFLPVIPDGMAMVTEKRTQDSSQEGPAVKSARTDRQRVSAPHRKEYFAFTRHLTDVPASEQKSESTDASHPVEPVPAAVPMEIPPFFPMERPTLVLPTTPKHNGQPTTSGTARQIVNHDHHYETTPKTLRKKLALSRTKIKTLQNEARVHKQKITRMKNKISLLKDIVSELRRTQALPDSGLACLDSIALTDVSQFLKRYAKNQKNMSESKPRAEKKQ